MLLQDSMGNILQTEAGQITMIGMLLECYYLKILHLSDMHLPDWRMRKSASTDLNLGHEVFLQE